MNRPQFAFFGTPDIAVNVLEELEKAELIPSLIVTNPDRPSGRKMTITPPPVKSWAEERNISVTQPESLSNDDSKNLLQESSYDLFVVVAYGLIIPKEVLAYPEYKCINMHPSLLPKLRGASPIRSAILTDARNTGVTIIEMDEQMDHGPIIDQLDVVIPEEDWPMRGRELDEKLARAGGKLLAKSIPDWITGMLPTVPQEHGLATFCGKISKEDGEIDLADDPYQNLLKIRAYDGWPGTFFFVEKEGARVRVKIMDAEIANDGSLNILRVIPEGKNEIDYEVFLNS